MGSTVIVDASVAIKWLVHEDDSDSARALRRRWSNSGTYLSAPEFLLVELQNIIWKKLMRGILQANDPIIGQTPLFGLDFNWTPTKSLLSSAFLIAIQKKITVYDGLYVALAQTLEAPLYTADRALVAKLQGMAITVQTI